IGRTARARGRAKAEARRAAQAAARDRRRAGEFVLASLSRASELLAARSAAKSRARPGTPYRGFFRVGTLAVVFVKPKPVIMGPGSRFAWPGRRLFEDMRCRSLGKGASGSCPMEEA